jgi:phosphoglucosamine mutase
MVRRYFGTDGIRGRANGVITPELALRVGQAAGLVFRRGEHRHRAHQQERAALRLYDRNRPVAGFTSVGMDVQTAIPTPAVMLTRSMRCDLGMMISASLNPYDDNGIKHSAPTATSSTDRHKIRRSFRPFKKLGARLGRASASMRATVTSSSPSARCRGP